MMVSAIGTKRGQRPLALTPRVALVLLGAAALLLLAVPFGWRFHLWDFHLSFQMVAWARDLALAAAIVAAIGLVFARVAIGGRGRLLAACLIIVGIAIVYVPWQWARLHGPYPTINDITTDSANPPQFVAALPARAAEQAVSAAYGGVATAQLQQAAYPDIAPVIVAAPPSTAFARALSAARAMRFWTILTDDPRKGIIEASATTLYFGFTDDIVIRVTPEGAGSRVDIRSHSRQGSGDLGVNAARVRTYLAALKAAG